MRLRPSAWLQSLLEVSVPRGDRTPGPGYSDRVLALLEAQGRQAKASEGKGARKRTPDDTPASSSTALTLPLRPYTPQALVALFVEQPGLTFKEYASAFGRGAGWLASVVASDSFQTLLTSSEARALIADPAIVGTMEERFRALAIQSLAVLQDKLDSAEASEFLVTKAAELSIKALGMGQVAPAAPSEPQQPVGAEAVADRIMKAMEKARLRSMTNPANVVDVAATVVPAPAEVRDGG